MFLLSIYCFKPRMERTSFLCGSSNFFAREKWVWLLNFNPPPHKTHLCHRLAWTSCDESPPRGYHRERNYIPQTKHFQMVLLVNCDSACMLWCRRASMWNRCLVMTHTHTKDTGLPAVCVRVRVRAHINPCKSTGCITIRSSQQSQMSHSSPDAASSMTHWWLVFVCLDT